MNLVLFEATEIDRPLSRSDRRARHITEVLRREVGQSFDAGIVNGPLGKATLAAVNQHELAFSFTWARPVEREIAITLIVGATRPQSARDILRDATTLGAAAIHFVRAEKTDPNYLASSLWSSGEWRRHVLVGAEQSFTTAIPEVHVGAALAETIATASAGTRLALDNYESNRRLGELPRPDATATLAVGPERGWSAAERIALRQAGYELVHLGHRVLRTETACIAALTLVRAKLGLM